MDRQLTEQDLYLFNEGRHFELHQKLGAQVLKSGVHFSVWAPNARSVSVIGEFNNWDQKRHSLKPVKSSGLWSATIPEAKVGDRYKFHIKSHNQHSVDKRDPFAFYCEPAPQTAGIVWQSQYAWEDGEWMKERHQYNSLNSPISIYEMHLGSWRRHDSDNSWLSYIELAQQLPEYLKKLGYTHVEFLPVMEHPFYGSWGYQTTGYFAPTSRYGNPDDFKHLVDKLHQAGIGVILDWVPSHFPTDEHGLAYFDGTHLYEHSDPRQGFHPDWNSMIFNYGRAEVKSFLISSALYWLKEFHLDGLRVDAVASMLYLDYSRKHGEWIPNKYGGRENLEAIQFLKELNQAAYEHAGAVQIYAEESTAWPMVSKPTYLGGLGFGMKWDMGWMHDTLEYFKKDAIHRKYHHQQLTFRMIYANNENFCLSLSHDEVVHGKGSMLNKMSGDVWQKFANLRTLYCYQYTQPGKKLLFMGSEFAPWTEWNHEQSLDWHLCDQSLHQGMSLLIGDLNKIYRQESALHKNDFDPQGFEWIDTSDAGKSVLSFMRKFQDEFILAVFNLTPVPRHNYKLGVPRAGAWQEILNSDATCYGGSGQGNIGGCHSNPFSLHGHQQSLNLTLPPLSSVIFKWKGEQP